MAGNRVVLVKMFDAAGEIFQNPDRIRELHYLRAGSTLVFVLDPLSVPALWENIDGERRGRLEPIRAVGAPDAVLQQTVKTLHDIAVDTNRYRLAVVVSKSDLINPEIENSHLGDDQSIQDWLAGPLEQGNLVRAVQHNFGSARFFLASSLFGGRATDPSIESFAVWMLAGEGMRL
jgi:hypothetical protein